MSNNASDDILGKSPLAILRKMVGAWTVCKPWIRAMPSTEPSIRLELPSPRHSNRAKKEQQSKTTLHESQWQDRWVYLSCPSLPRPLNPKHVRGGFMVALKRVVAQIPGDVPGPGTAGWTQYQRLLAIKLKSVASTMCQNSAHSCQRRTKGNSNQKQQFAVERSKNTRG